MSPDQTQAAGQAPRALLPSWANSQDAWCRSVTADILRTRAKLGDAAIDGYVKLLLAEKKLSDDVFEPVSKIEEKQPDGNPLEPVRLDWFQVGDGVNALKSGSQIDFGPTVTVIFGENGSGKSGFVRVLKRAAGVRTAEEILHNVRADEKSAPSAFFGVTVGATAQRIEWKNEFGLAPLNRVSIFDARGARLHLEEDLTYVYTPGELTLFPLVQNAIERVRTALEAAVASRTPGPNTILASFDRACSIYATIETLGAATDLNEIRQYAIVTEDIDVQIDTLKTEVDALRSANIQTELRRARDRAGVVTRVKTAIEIAKAFDVPTYLARLNARDQASERRDEVSSKAFEGLQIPGVLGREWQQFLLAGEEYIRANAALTYPAANDACAYCQQPLSAAAVALIRKYRDFTNNAIKTAVDSADTTLRAYVKSLLDLDIKRLQQQLADEAGGGADILDRAKPVFQHSGIRSLEFT